MYVRSASVDSEVVDIAIGFEAISAVAEMCASDIDGGVTQGKFANKSTTIG